MPVFTSVSQDVALCAQFLLAAGESAIHLEHLFATFPRTLNRDQQLDLFNTFLRHTVLFERAGGILRPKHHLMLHCLRRSGFLGNPRYYTTYRDESLNGVVARIARSTHRWSLMRTCHRKFNGLNSSGVSTQMH